MPKALKMYTKSGRRLRLTRFALSCGYVERKGDGDNRAVLESEHGIFHVKGFKQGVRFWESFDSLPDARKFYDSILSGEVDA